MDEFPVGNEVGEDAVEEGAPSGSARDNCEPSQSGVGRLLQQRTISRYRVVARQVCIVAYARHVDSSFSAQSRGHTYLKFSSISLKRRNCCLILAFSFARFR